MPSMPESAPTARLDGTSEAQDTATLRGQATHILHGHGYSCSQPALVGKGAQSICFSADDLVVLMRFGNRKRDVHVFADYPTQQWAINKALTVGVLAPAILHTGARPVPYAIAQNAERVLAASAAGRSQPATTDIFRALGESIRQVNSVPVTGFGEFVVDDALKYRGQHASWADYLTERASFCAIRSGRDHEGSHTHSRFLAENILDAGHFAKILAHVEAAKQWNVAPVLVHYDNRTENVCVAGDRVVLMDWGLTIAGIGLPQEMVKVSGSENKQAFLDGYGMPVSQRVDVLKQRDLFLVLEGLALCRLAVEDNAPLGALRHWFESIARIISPWE